MDLFDEISKVKKDFPKDHVVKDKVSKQELNFYQIFAIGMFTICFFLGIVFGNLFSTCTATSYYSASTCLVTEFNYFLMFTIWFISLLVAIFIFGLGHIISILSQINEKISKFNS